MSQKDVYTYNQKETVVVIMGHIMRKEVLENMKLKDHMLNNSIKKIIKRRLLFFFFWKKCIFDYLRLITWSDANRNM